MKDAREVVEPIPDDDSALELPEPIDELARALGDKVLVFADRGGPHAAVPVLAAPEVRLRVLDRDHGQRRLREEPSDEFYDERYELCKCKRYEEVERSGRTRTLGETGCAEEGIDDGTVADRYFIWAWTYGVQRMSIGSMRSKL